MLTNFTWQNDRPALDVANIVAGLALVLSPWLLGYAADAYAVWHACIAGIVIVLLAAGALLAFRQYEEWANLAVGLWTLAAPWLLGFSAVTAAMWTHVIVGIVAAVLAASTLWFAGNRPFSAA
jgi:hypothetical protein